MKEPEELWPDIMNGNHVEARMERLNQLNGLRVRTEKWLAILRKHPLGGPARAEMAGIVSDLKKYISQMDNL